jgi:hypothetical protein
MGACAGICTNCKGGEEETRQFDLIAMKKALDLNKEIEVKGQHII